jgi:hypothetical protein
MSVTRGLWHVGQGNGQGSIFADQGRMKMVDGVTTLFPVATVVRGLNEAEDEANGVLLASAPALLGMLVLALKYMDHPDVQALPFACPAAGVADRMRKLIATARGDADGD